nr:PREDICTED: cilia- and flagella-associated protein 44 [Latimeria chalumnae]|eukprot:XP_006000125.2 PREDICTED: cilia- and flagella-associated protein 44 [Latimeria chalumnae]
MEASEQQGEAVVTGEEENMEKISEAEDGGSRELEKEEAEEAAVTRTELTLKEEDGQQSDSVEAEGIQEPSSGEAEGIQEPSSGEAEGTGEPSLGEAEGTGEPSSGEAEGTQELSSGEAEGTGEPSSGDAEGVQQSSSGEAEGIQEPSSGEAEGIQQSRSGEAEGTQQPSSGEAEGIQEPSSGEAEGIKDPSSGEAERIQQSSSGEAEGIQQSRSGEAEGIQEPSSGEAEGTQQPSSGEAEGIQEPSSGEAEGIQEPSSGEAEGKEPSSVEAEGIQKPSSEEAEGTQQPSSEEAEGIQEPSSGEAEGKEPSSVEAEGIQQPSSGEAEGIQEPSSGLAVGTQEMEGGAAVAVEKDLSQPAEEDELEDDLGEMEAVGKEYPTGDRKMSLSETEEAIKKEVEKKIPADFFYNYEDICSKPFVTLNSGIPLNLLYLTHSFGYDCNKRANLQLLDDSTVAYVAGNVLVLLKLKTKEQQYLRSSSDGGIGAIMVHPSKKYFVVAEKGLKPNIVIYEYPSLRPYRILRDGTLQAYAFVDFNSSGSLLASVGGSPDFMLTVWDWKQEKIVLRSKAFSQDIFRVTFSPENDTQLTTSGSTHIKFWKMALTFTGLKLQGELGRFGKTTLTDIEGYVELPDGKVLSGSEWGNMLLWDGGLIKVELCRRGRKSCHVGPINQFVLDEGELITIGADGCVRVWDFETIDAADSTDDCSWYELEPMNELVVGRNVNLLSMVKTSDPDSAIWFAQDANGGIWKLDLSFSNITQDPECLFSFHSREICGLDVSPVTHLMATTALDHSVRIFDFLGKQPLTEMRFKQGGTTLTWAPRIVNRKGGLIVVGFEDGVVRLLELYNPKGLTIVAGRMTTGDAELRLKQAFKPHTAAVTAVAYDRNGEILATGSVDGTVFFFLEGDRYKPIGFVKVLGPVQALVWSPHLHVNNTLLVLCKNGYVVQVLAPDPEKHDSTSTYEIQNLYKFYFRFKSIKSRIQRENEIIRRQKVKEQKKKDLEEKIKKMKEMDIEITEEDLKEEPEEEEELPPIYIPEDPSPILSGFYSIQNSFWLVMGGYDSGFLYHCHFSGTDDPNNDPTERWDEPLGYLPLENVDENPIQKVCFSSNKRLLLCGMENGQVRVYPLQSNDLIRIPLEGYWELNSHDNNYGCINGICTSYDDQFIVTCGADSNIFVFSVMPEEDIEEALKAKKATVPSPRKDLEKEKAVEDIEDPNAYSIENAKQRAEWDRVVKLAEEKKLRKRQHLAQLQTEFKMLLTCNMELPEHMQLTKEDFELDERIREEMERKTAQRMRLVRKELAWEQEKHRIGLQKLQARYRDPLEFDTVMVKAFESNHLVTTYRLPTFSEKYQKLKREMDMRAKEKISVVCLEDSDDQSSKDIVEVEEKVSGELPYFRDRIYRLDWLKLGQQAMRLLKIMLKAEKAKDKIKKRKKEWEDLYASKPDENYEDPRDVVAIQEAQENMGDFKLKSAIDYSVPEHLRINTEKKKKQLVVLEAQISDLLANFDAELCILRHQKLKMDIELKLVDLRHVTLFEELLLLKEYEKREDALQERVNNRVSERNEIQRKSEECALQLEVKKKDIAKLHDSEKALYSSFFASLGESSKFTDFLTKVFKKKIKRVKKESKRNEDNEENSDEESEEESELGSEEDESGSEAGGMDDSACPADCDPELFENTLRLREKRLDLEDAVAEEKKVVDNLKKESESLGKKIKIVEASLKTAKADLEAFQREKQQKLNGLFVVVPLKLHQVEFLQNGEIPNDLSQALVFPNQALLSLQQRIKELQMEKGEKRNLYKEARHQHVQLIRDRRELEAKIKILEEMCREMMMMKFGRVVDLEALQTLSVNRTLEDLRERLQLCEMDSCREIAQWEDKISVLKELLRDVVREHTHKLEQMNSLLTCKKTIETHLNAQQKKMSDDFQEKRKAEIEERQKMIQLIQLQANEIISLKEEICLLSKKGGHILPPVQSTSQHNTTEVKNEQPSSTLTLNP